MFKKLYVPLLLLSLLLLACEENTNTTEPTPNSDTNSGNFIPIEGWAQHALASNWYQNLVIPSEDFYTEMIDFEGDDLPELFIGFNGPNYGYIIGQYNQKEKAWEEWTAEHYETTTHGAIHFKGRLMGTANKEIALITNFSAGALDSLEILHLLKISEDGEKVVSGKSFRLYNENDLTVDTASNSFTIQGENDAEQFTISDHVVSSKYGTSNLYTGIPILQNEALKNLLNHDFFTTNIQFGDTFPIAQHKAGNPKKEEYYEGGYCSFYENFFFCLAEEEIPLASYTLSNFTNISKTSLEKAINQNISIASYERYGDSEDIVYYAIFEVDHVYFHAEFNNDQDNAELTNLTLSMNKLE